MYKKKGTEYLHSQNTDNDAPRLFDEKDIKNILEHLPTPLFVTDREGNVLISNSFTAFTMGITLQELLESNLEELVNKGLYNTSYALQAAKEKKTITGEIRTKSGINSISTSTPIFDGNGEVSLVVTYSKPYNLTEDCNLQGKKEIENRLRRELEYLRMQKISDKDIIVESFVMKQIYKKCLNVANTDSSVLIFGESGTGKEVLSKYIHQNSKRKIGPFISINCSAIPEALFESELFGYEKGAFTGANNSGKMGLIEIAHEGTLFLDEISEMPLPLQAKMLKVLDSSEIRRIGGTENHKVNFRLICATNRDLTKMVEEENFRKDLFYRINVIPINIPPLRSRPEDLIALSEKFLQGFNKKYNRDYKLNQSEIQYLLRHNWPGNVRELKNYIERLVVTNNDVYFSESSSENSLDKKRISQLYLRRNKQETLKEFMKFMEEEYIRETLAECQGKVGETAKRLGIYRTVLYRKLKTFNEKKN